MHALLSPVDLPREEAVEQCDRYLRSRWRRWRVASRTLPGSARSDLIALLAWHELAYELSGLESATHDNFESRRGLDELARELDAVYGGVPTSAAGLALAWAVRRHELPALSFRGTLEALKQDRAVRAYETEGELLVHVKKRTHAQPRLLLRVTGHASERNEILGDALATGIQLTSWIANLSADWERGHLYVPLEEVFRHGVDLEQIAEARFDRGAQRLVALQVERARSFLAKGWPLCEALGPWHGRQLAFVLRWHAATLAAIEERGFDVFRGPPPAGWLRVLACGVASGISFRMG